MTSAVQLEELKTGQGAILLVKINRPQAANAFDATLMRELTDVFSKATVGLRALVLTGEGKHFSAGADLAWMKEAARFDYEENVADSKLLLQMFTAYERISVPTVAVVRGAAFGGAVGLIAASDVVICDRRAKLCLSEARLGLLPAVIYPFLARRINHGALKAWALTAKTLTAEQAQAIHLVDEVSDEPTETLQEVLNQILQCGPQAQAKIKELHAVVLSGAADVGERTLQFIAEARTGGEAQAGLAAFFEKNKAPWCEKISESISL